MSAIEWTDRTWNPVRGCLRVSEGCRHCYAERMAARFCKPGEPFHGFAKVIAPRDSLDRVGGRRNGWTGRVELVPEKLDEPLRWRKPARVFVNSMSDLFHEALSDEAIDQVFAVMALARDHTFQILTKRPERMRRYFSGPGWGKRAIAGPEGHGIVQFLQPLPNVWLGVSVEDQETADERIPLLLQTPASRRFVSYEPALGAVTLRTLISANPVYRLNALDPHPDGLPRRWLDWVIVGGESGPGARPFNVDWARTVVRQCREAGVACFVKQLGANAINVWEPRVRLKHPKGGDPAEWPEDLRVREMPRARVPPAPRADHGGPARPDGLPEGVAPDQEVRGRGPAEAVGRRGRRRPGGDERHGD